MSLLFTDFELDQALLRALEQMQLITPTPIQTAMLPPVLSGKDIQASAETGSGKTAAFLLPVCHRLLQDKKPDTATRCLILLPTRELAEQTYQFFTELAQFTFLQAALVLGGKEMRPQMAKIRKNPDILIATPGRMQDHVQRKSVELKDLEVLVVDEADRMLDMGLREAVLSIIAACNPARQSIMLSATLNHAGVGRIAQRIVREPEIISIGDREQPKTIHQQVILADDNEHKRRLLNWLLANEAWEKTLVFTNTRDAAEVLAVDLGRRHAGAAVLHGELDRNERKRVMGQFRSGKQRLLVATDLAARGLDVPGVDLVVNFAMSRSGDEYVHRIGRTGRAGRSGLAISLISAQEWNRLCSIERYLGISIERRTVENLVARFKGIDGKKKRVSRRTSTLDGKADQTPRQAKPKQRWREKKNIGKRRQPNRDKVEIIDGSAPLTKKK